MKEKHGMPHGVFQPFHKTHMDIIVGSVIFKDDKVLMVKEAKEKCFGKWAFPAGHLEVNETIFEGVKRETFEETGCEIELKKVFPIFTKNTEDMNIAMFHFLADLVNETSTFDNKEIAEIKWITIDELKSMNQNEFRSYAVIKQIFDSIEKGNLYQLDMIKNMPDI